MTAPNIDSSTREKRLDYVLNEWKCLHNCEPMEQREQKPNKFGLCRVATEEDDSQPMEQREQYQACLEYCRGTAFDDGQNAEEDVSQMAHIRSYTADDCRHWRQHRSLGRYATLASQDDAQEVQVWHTHNNHHAG